MALFQLMLLAIKIIVNMMLYYLCTTIKVIPYKMTSFNKGVNFTAGMDYIRTSPDHGPAYDIVGTNKINSKSFINSILLAKKFINQD